MKGFQLFEVNIANFAVLNPKLEVILQYFEVPDPNVEVPNAKLEVPDGDFEVPDPSVGVVLSVGGVKDVAAGVLQARRPELALQPCLCPYLESGDLFILAKTPLKKAF